MSKILLQMKQYTFTKTIVECYKFRNPAGGYADITIDAIGTTGRISIASDWGDYQYYWSACGKPFKEFLSQLGIDYLAGKFGANKFFDLDTTIRLYKEQVRENFRKDDPQKEIINK